MSIIFKDGVQDISVPFGNKISITCANGTAIVYYSTAPNSPDSFYEETRVTSGSSTLGTFTTDRIIRVEASGDNVTYDVAVNPVTSPIDHNILSNLQGGDASEYYHLNASASGLLGGIDQSVSTTSNVMFNDVKSTGKLNVGAPSGLTISSGVVTPTKSRHFVDTEAAAASDDLNTITAGANGDVLIIQSANSARTVVVKDNVDNIKLSSDFTMSNSDDRLTLQCDSVNWFEVARSRVDTPSTDFDFDISGAGLVVNLDASVVSSIAFTGVKIQSWTDQKNSLSFSQSTDANRPILQLEGVRFDGTQWLETPSFAGLNLTSAMSIFTVSTPDDITSPTNSALVNHSNGANGYQFRYGSSPAGEARLNFPAVADQSAGVVSFESDKRGVIGVVFGAGSFDYRKNGFQIGATKATANAISASVPTRVGATHSGSEGWVGTIKQILIYNTKLSGTDITNVEQALISKWAK